MTEEYYYIHRSRYSPSQKRLAGDKYGGRNSYYNTNHSFKKLFIHLTTMYSHFPTATTGEISG